ncbi:MAG: hypothetical protein HC873_16080, partial [Leptolyngbyaceae cyanobacterium SL_1_1]|nr:hypothetical protein [Leptolyngbyaceae cyanobacterium SL_1_1]
WLPAARRRPLTTRSPRGDRGDRNYPPQRPPAADTNPDRYQGTYDNEEWGDDDEWF